MSYPRTIENGAGERLTFLGIREDDEGRYAEARVSAAPGSGPPMHVHHQQSETLTVESGVMAYQREGEEERRAHPGDTVTFPAGDVHRFWNAGDGELVCVGEIRPPGNFEYFIGEVFASMEQGGRGRPQMGDAAFLLSRYRTEFDMTEIPRPVVRFVFPVLNAIGRVLGRHRRFHGAPEPLPAA